MVFTRSHAMKRSAVLRRRPGWRWYAMSIFGDPFRGRRGNLIVLFYFRGRHLFGNAAGKSSNQGSLRALLNLGLGG